MSRIGPCGVHRGVRLGIESVGRPNAADYSLETGIRPESNTRPEGPGEVPYGVVNAHLEKPSF
jgi:hypothetical protein